MSSLLELSDDALRELLEGTSPVMAIRRELTLFHSFYDAPDLPPEIAAEHANGWIDALQPLPLEAVKRALMQWLHSPSPYLPKIGQLLEIAEEIVRTARKELKRRSQISSGEPARALKPKARYSELDLASNIEDWRTFREFAKEDYPDISYGALAPAQFEHGGRVKALDQSHAEALSERWGQVLNTSGATRIFWPGSEEEITL